MTRSVRLDLRPLEIGDRVAMDPDGRPTIGTLRNIEPPDCDVEIDGEIRRMRLRLVSYYPTAEDIARRAEIARGLWKPYDKRGGECQPWEIPVLGAGEISAAAAL